MGTMRVSCSLHWMIIIAVMSLQIHGGGSCLTRERKALLNLKAYFKFVSDSNFTDNVLASWPDDGTSNCCHWERVKCNAETGRVVELALGDSVYPSEESAPGSSHLLNLSLLHPFEELRVLDLKNNYFKGWFDDIRGFKSFPRLKMLESLNLEVNSFNNSVLCFLSSTASLKTLNLSGNVMEGVFPPKELAELINLRIIDASHNKFSLLSAEGFSNLTSLEALDLSDNRFSGHLQIQGICELKHLRELDLSRNKFRGHLPDCLSNLTHLRVLDVTSNRFTGNLHPVISRLTSLEYLSLYDNNFKGTFPLSSLANHSKLEVFRLSSKPGRIKVKDDGSWLPTFQLKALQLRECNLNRTLPSCLVHQSHLRFLDLSCNNLFGTIPSWLFQNNSKLEALYLMKNLFTDLQLPKETHGLLHLEVSDNKIEGLLPKNILTILPKLECVNFSRNAFQGGVPSEMGKLKSLEILDLSHNNLSGLLPRAFVTGGHSLKFLRLSGNNFHGQIFPEYANLTQLMWLHVDNNNFTGSLGKGLSMSISLVVLDVSSNNLSGQIPEWIGTLQGLKYLLMGKNRLEGEIPVQLKNLIFLRLLDLSDNSLSGSITSRFKLPELHHLSLENNNLVGSIPDALFESEGLVTLDLRNNSFSGGIPKSIGRLSNLNVLLLRANHMLGDIPHEICQLRQVNILDLSHNSFSGSVPSCISDMSFGMIGDKASKLPTHNIMNFEDDKQGTYYQYSSVLVQPTLYAEYEVFNSRVIVEFVTKSRYESFEGGVLPYMFGLDLSSNKLTGDIPTQIGDLQKLHALNLSHNRFTGSIPERVSNLKKIESLDLSYNRLQGHIPPEIAELYTLGVFKVSYNNLSGPIPYNGQLTTFDETCYIGNPGLCGRPLNNSCYKTEAPDMTITHRTAGEDDTVIDFQWFYWSFGASYVVILLGLLAFLSIESRWSREWFRLVDACVSSLEELKCRSVIFKK